MSTAVNTKKSGRIQNTVAVAIVGFGIIVSSFGFAQASEPTPATTTPASVTTTVHVTSTTAVGGVLGK